MAITCEWKDRLGSANINLRCGEKVQVTFYTGGNCTACICTEDKTLADFICDIPHLKRILGEDGGHWKTEYTDIRLNGWYPEAWKVARELTKFGIEVTMYREVCK